MTLNQMKYFITVARCLSFTEGAKSLFITQPALSRQIAAMEEELGTQLFVREKKTLKLTPGGTILYNGLPRILETYGNLVEEARNANQGYAGQLRIGFLDVYDIGELIPPVLEVFQRRYPQIHLTMERFSLGALPDCLYQNSLDLILTYGFSLHDKPDLVTVNIQKFDSCIMLNQNHPLAGKPDLTMTDLKNELFVQLDRRISEEGYQYIMNLCGKYGVYPNIKMVRRMEDVLLWVQTGNGVAITTNRTIEKLNPQVVIREIPIPEAKGHDVTMAWRKNNYNPAIALFMELLEKHVGE